MTAWVKFRVDCQLPASLSPSTTTREHVAVELFDDRRLEEVLTKIEELKASIVSAITIKLEHDFIHEWKSPETEWVAAVVQSNNHEWIAGKDYQWPYDWSNQRVPAHDPLLVYTSPRGLFSKVGYQFAARASFRKFVDAMPESFEYTGGEIIRKGKQLAHWSRVEPIRQVTLLSSDSLGLISTTFHPRPFRSHLLWMGQPCTEDFGFVWDKLKVGWFEQQTCALLPVETAIKLSKRFFADFLAYPVYDRNSPTAKRALEVFEQITERITLQGWTR